MEFTPLGIWTSMGLLAKVVVTILGLMSIYSLGLMIERWLTFRAAKKQSLEFAIQATKFLKPKI